MTSPAGDKPLSRRGALTGAAAVLVLAAGSTVTVAAASGAFDSAGPSCTVPALPGTTVTVQLVDMRSMMSRRAMMAGLGTHHGAMMRQPDWRYFHRGMMRVLASPTSVPAGTVSLKVTNTGFLTHELVVLSLAGGQLLGDRTVRSDGTVDEAGSLGEASASCAAGDGDGIAPGSAGWVSLHLPAGRYELLCNLPGHYAAGMYTELDVG